MIHGRQASGRQAGGAFVLEGSPARRLSLLGTRLRPAALGPAAPPQEWVACEMAPGEVRGRGCNPSIRSGVLGPEPSSSQLPASCRAWALGQSPGPSVLCRVGGQVYLPFPSSEIRHLPLHSARGLGRSRTLETSPGITLGVGRRAAGGGRSPGPRPGSGPAWLRCGHIWAQQHLGSGPGQHLGQCLVPRGQTVGSGMSLFHRGPKGCPPSSPPQQPGWIWGRKKPLSMLCKKSYQAPGLGHR